MAEPLDQPLGVVTLDELADDSARLDETLEAMKIEALLLERPHEPLDDAIAFRLADVRRSDGHPQPLHLVDPGIGDVYCGPQSHRIRSPRATSFAKRPNTWRTPWRSGSSAAQRSPIFAVCQPTSSATQWSRAPKSQHQPSASV